MLLFQFFEAFISDRTFGRQTFDRQTLDRQTFHRQDISPTGHLGELLLEQISAGISVGPSKKIYQTLNLRLKAIVRDLDLNADSFLDYIRAIAHNL